MIKKGKYIMVDWKGKGLKEVDHTYLHSHFNQTLNRSLDMLPNRSDKEDVEVLKSTFHWNKTKVRSSDKKVWYIDNPFPLDSDISFIKI
jgi:hypothetical protein